MIQGSGQASWADPVWVEMFEHNEGQHVTSSSGIDLDAEWGCPLTAGTCRQFYHCVCFVALWGKDIIYHYLFWVGVSYGPTVNCINKQLITCGCFLSANLYYVGFPPLSTVSMMGGLLSSIGLSRLLACSTRAVALCMPVTFFGTAFADGVPCWAVVMARGVWIGAVRTLWGILLWLFLLRLMALAEGMDGFISLHCSPYRLNGIVCVTDLQ